MKTMSHTNPDGSIVSVCLGNGVSLAARKVAPRKGDCNEPTCYQTVYAPKHLDEVGRCECCKRKPLVYKRTRDPRYPRGHFCSRCDRAYSLETGAQIGNWAWRAVDGGFQSTAKRRAM